MRIDKLRVPWKQLLGCFCLFLLFSISALTAYGEESELNFFVQPILPESQLDGGASSYFDLNLAAGDSDTLEIEIQNSSDEEITVTVSAHTAFTNVNGLVEYGKDATEPDSTLPVALDALMTTPREVNLEPMEKKIISLTLTMPEESFEGVLAGGIRLQEVLPEDGENSHEEGIAITNAFSYVLGVVVSNQRTKIDPELDLLDVFANQVNYRNVISATLQNPVSTYINQLTVNATIREEGAEDILYETSRSDMQMAPNSQFDFPIYLNGESFRSGTYVLKLTAYSEGQEWSWEETFTIEANQARALNRADVTIDSPINWWMIGMLALLSILAIASLGFYLKKSKTQRNS